MTRRQRILDFLRREKEERPHVIGHSANGVCHGIGEARYAATGVAIVLNRLVDEGLVERDKPRGCHGVEVFYSLKEENA
jgi:predicted transcriptional regulator